MDTSRTHDDETFPFSGRILAVLMRDRTTGGNVVWATEDYAPISARSQVRLPQITGRNAGRIKPRSQKSKSAQMERTRNKAEVFTPSWICNAQNNLIDEAWFGRKDVFNKESKSEIKNRHAELDSASVNGEIPKQVRNDTLENCKRWTSTKGKIAFSIDIQSGKTWRDYVNLTRLEITCGEAPYLVSRYDTVNGNQIRIEDRIGLLDRKMRVVCENAQNEAEYFLWTKIAFQNCYGFELQGDNLLLARANMLLSFNEYTKFFLKRNPTEEEQKEIAEIISWNLWQMDGLTFCTPFSSPDDGQISLFEEFDEQKKFPCKIMDWKKNKTLLYKSLVKKRGG